MKQKRPVAVNGNGNALGNWLKDRCQQEHLSLRQAATKANLSHATISDIINGGRPSAATIVKLAEAFSNGDSHKEELKDQLLSLVGYRGERIKGEMSDAVARVVEKLNHVSPDQLEVIESLASFVTESGKHGIRGARSSTGVLVLPRLRLNFYLTFDEEDTGLGLFSKLPPDMQETLINLSERYKKETGQSPDLPKADERSSSNNNE